MEKVIIRKCENYDPDKIAAIVSESITELDAVPYGKTLVKPNTVIAHEQYYPHAYTRPEVLDGIFTALKWHGTNIKELTLGERCGITIPTRYVFAEAKYPAIIKKHNLKTSYFEEEIEVKIPLEHPPARRPFIYVPRTIYETDFFINVPKFKSHPWTKVTFALKNLIGIQDDKHRIIDHDHKLEYKIADLQQAVNTGLIVVDGIISGQKTMLTPIPFPLGILVIGTNPVAVDAVCSRIVGLDPNKVDHIKICAERNIGPIKLKDIDISGDISLKTLQKKTKNYILALDKVDDIFIKEKSSIKTYSGSPPDADEYDYCWGGCPGALYEAMQIIQTIQPEVYRQIKPLHMVFGDVEGQKIEPKNDEPVFFLGDCARFSGKIKDKQVDISSIYKEKDEFAPLHAKSSDLHKKIINFILFFIANFNKKIMRFKGCPVSVAESVLICATYGKTKNPYLDSKIFVKFAISYVISKVVKFFKVTLRKVFFGEYYKSK